MLDIVIKNFWNIIFLLFPAIIVYLFNRRSKHNDLFLNKLAKSYENTYFPMYIQLKKIKEEQNGDQKLELFKEFIEIYNSNNSTLKFIASTVLLEWFFDMHQKYLVFCRQDDENSKKLFWKSFDAFYVMIENEFWEAHDIIYNDYFVSKTLINNNPFIRFIMELNIFLYNIAIFLLYLSGFILYVSIWNRFMPLIILPNWWTVEFAVLLFLGVLTMQSFMIIISSWYLSIQNNRKHILFSKKLDEKAKKVWQKLGKFARRVAN